jgi:hypothetical protein
VNGKVVSRAQKESMWGDTDHDVVVKGVQYRMDSRGILLGEALIIFIYLLASYVELSGRRVEAATALHFHPTLTTSLLSFRVGPHRLTVLS